MLVDRTSEKEKTEWCKSINRNLVIAASNAEADKTHNHIVDDVEAAIIFQHDSEASRQTAMLADVLAQAFDAVRANDEPEFERAEATRERNAPMLQWSC